MECIVNIAGHVGSDIVAALLSSDYSMEEQIWQSISEPTVKSSGPSGKVLACFTAAGPAFEGAFRQHGMRATGAIEGVKIHTER